MTREEMAAKAQIIRGRDRFGPMTEEELAALPGTERELSIPVAEGRSVRVYEIRPDAPVPDCCPLIINYHGGGFVKGRADRDKRYCCHLAQELNCLVWDVDYCLAPEEPFPAAVQESYGAASYAFAHAPELGIDPERIILAGHSAGGNLVAAAMLQAVRSGSFRPRALLMEYFPADQSISPVDKLSKELRGDPWWVQRAQTEGEYTLFYCDGAQALDPLCSPLRAEAAELAQFPDSLIISAGKDTLQRETEAFALKLAGAGVTVTLRRVPEAVHGFTTNRTEGWETALGLHCKFFRQHLY